jgi:hypothetical protein
MTRATLPTLAGLLLLLAGCSQNRYDPYPYPQDNRGYHDDSSWSPARQALRMKNDLRLSDRQIQRLVVIERDFNRDRNRGYADSRRNQAAEQRAVDRVLDRRQRNILYRSWNG